MKQIDELRKAVRLLMQIGYPRRGTVEENQTLQDFADLIQREWSAQDLGDLTAASESEEIAALETQLRVKSDALDNCVQLAAAYRQLIVEALQPTTLLNHDVSKNRKPRLSPKPTSSPRPKG